MANVEGKATAITVLTPVRRHGPLVLAVVFWAGRHLTATLKKLQQLSFIHYARWAVIERFPNDGAASASNVPTCSSRATSTAPGTSTSTRSQRWYPTRMKAIWGTSYGFPGPIPVGPFKAYIRRNEFVANHYWSAYPGATTTEIIAAERVAAALERFGRRSARLDPQAFKAAYETMLESVQGDL